MIFRKGLSFILMAALAGGLFCFTACENGNIFGGLHDRGDSGDPAALLSDADVALREGDFAEALSLYNRVLDKEPNNAKALYGSAAAYLGTSGLNLGVLITNVLQQAPGSSSVSGLPDLLQQANLKPSVAITTDPNSILNGIDLESLNDAIDQIICRLARIVSGDTDGAISRDNIDVLVNLGILHIVRAAIRPIRAGFIDITNVGGTYEIVDKTGDHGATFCSNAANHSLIEGMTSDIAAGYTLFNRAVTVLNLDNDRLIAQLRNDIDAIMNIVLTPAVGEDLDGACIAVINGMGITNLTNFKSYSTVLTTPPSGC